MGQGQKVRTSWELSNHPLGVAQRARVTSIKALRESVASVGLEPRSCDHSSLLFLSKYLLGGGEVGKGL